MPDRRLLSPRNTYQTLFWKSRSWPELWSEKSGEKTACPNTSLFSVAASISGRGFLIGWLKWFKSLRSSYSPPRRFVTWPRPIPRSSNETRIRRHMIWRLIRVSWRQQPLPPASWLLRHGHSFIHSFIHLISYCY